MCLIRETRVYRKREEILVKAEVGNDLTGVEGPL